MLVARLGGAGFHLGDKLREGGTTDVCFQVKVDVLLIGACVTAEQRERRTKQRCEREALPCHLRFLVNESHPFFEK